MNDIFEEFKEKSDIMETIRDYYHNNKKVVDVIISINNILNSNNSTNIKQSNLKGVEVSSNINLLGDDTGVSKGIGINLLVSYNIYTMYIYLKN